MSDLQRFKKVPPPIFRTISRAMRLFSIRLFGLLFSLFCGFAFVSCSTKPTIEECRTSLANFLRIQFGDSATPTEINRMVTEEPISIRMTQRCMEKKTKKQVQCEMSAPSQAELLKCARFAKKD